LIDARNEKVVYTGLLENLVFCIIRFYKLDMKFCCWARLQVMIADYFVKTAVDGDFQSASIKVSVEVVVILLQVWCTVFQLLRIYSRYGHVVCFWDSRKRLF
jgi:hypothetical protein